MFCSLTGLSEPASLPGLQPQPWDAAMQAALQQAGQAAAVGEVPVGAVIVFEGEIIARAHNRRETWADPLAHAEILVIAAAAAHLKRWRLTGCTLVCTLEPCPMCAGALVNARVPQVVFGATDSRGGAVGSLMNLLDDGRLNHRAEVVGGVQAAACGALLKNFFADRRRQMKTG
jgi:tRNA(adenine34) deaminase